MQSACLKAEWNRIDDCVPKIYLKVIHYLPRLWKTRGKTPTPTSTQLTTHPQAQSILLISSYRCRYRRAHLVNAYWQICNIVYFILLTGLTQRWTLYFFCLHSFLKPLFCFVWFPERVFVEFPEHAFRDNDSESQGSFSARVGVMWCWQMADESKHHGLIARNFSTNVKYCSCCIVSFLVTLENSRFKRSEW